MKSELPNEQRYLLLDNRIIEDTEKTKITLGIVEKHGSNPLFGEDKPWEARFDNLYANVIYDKEENLIRLISPVLMQLIIDNPELWQFLSKGKKK